MSAAMPPTSPSQAVLFTGKMKAVTVIPPRICGQCGEVSYKDETVLRLDQIVHSLLGMVSTEITMVSYTEQAA